MTDEKMTDAELKALVAGLATAQDRTDAQMAVNAAQQAKTDAKIDRLSDKIEELADRQAKTDAQMAETDAKIDRLSDKIEELADRQAKTDAQMAANVVQQAKTDAKIEELADRQAKTDAQMAANVVQQAKTDAKIEELADRQAKTDAQMAANVVQQAKTDAKIDRLVDQQAKTDAQLKKTEVLVRETSVEIKELSKMYGGASNNLGAAVEEFFYNSLKAHPVLGGVRFESVERNVPGEDGDLKNEFDLLLVNGREVFVVEVKHRAHKDDLDDLLNKKAPKFRRMFPKYAGHRHRFALATFHIHDELKESALEKGVTVLQRKGDVIETSPA